MRWNSILSIIILATLLGYLVPSPASAATSTESTNGFKIEFYNMKDAQVQYLQVLRGEDAAKLRADIDINFGNNDGKVTSDEVEATEEANTGTDTYLTMDNIITVQVNEFPGNPNYTLEVLDAEGSIVSTDPIDFNIYIDLAWNQFDSAQTYTLNITCLNETLPSYFYLTVPEDLTMDISTLYPQLLRTYASAEGIIVSETDMVKVSGYFKQTLTMDIPNPFYVPPPDNDQDGTPDEYDLDDDNDGMPDSWEIANGLDPFINDSAVDADGDGFSNYREFRSGTDPNDASSKPTEPEPEKEDNTLIIAGIFVLLVIIVLIIALLIYRKGQKKKK
jgi:hypothetical protein